MKNLKFENLIQELDSELCTLQKFDLNAIFIEIFYRTIKCTII